MAAFPGTSRAIVGISPLNRPLAPPSDRKTCLATSNGPLYFTVAVTAPSASALWACNLHFKKYKGVFGYVFRKQITKVNLTNSNVLLLLEVVKII
ncbi:hypothetical protein Hanom_Chr04g00302691 [Helianthus anomalus]